ncbi:MAG: ornithine cyclodeaminase family protein [Proteobacteria bacterium]|nr:ornithine cyclodeaminase family protein [Burkholderiales bacterium]
MSYIRMVRYLSQSETRTLLAWPEVIACLASVYERADDPRAAPPKVVARSGGVWLRALTAVSGEGGCMGVKIIAKGHPKAADHLIALWKVQTGALSCLMSAKGVTAMRTAGTSAVAVDRLVRKRALRVAVLGSGHEASSHVSALATVREITALAVYSPTAANRDAFAARFTETLSVPCHACGSPRAAVEGADVVIAAARSHDETPILQGSWLEPGMTVVSIGSTVPEQREVDPEVVRRATLIVADVPDEVAHETGDMIAARAAGVEFESRMVALCDLTRTGAMSRLAADDIVMFKSVGSALQDIAVSEMCFAKAEQTGIGTLLPMEL